MSQRSGNVLVVDDNRDVLRAIQLLLHEHVAMVYTTTNPAAIPTLLQEHACDVVLLDMNYNQDAVSGQEGFYWLRQIMQIDPSVVVMMITAYGDIDKAVHAMKQGATDFIVKPWSNDKLVASVQAALKLRQSRCKAARLEQQDPQPGEDSPQPFQEIIGISPAMQRVFDIVDKVAQTDADVLILGENGTGKELLARAVHRRSARSDAVFVNVDLGALSETLFESELFGHTKGAFTGADRDRTGRFETASGGTLFLDEIGNIPMSLQAKLLTVLERREMTRVGSNRPVSIDIRLICATNKTIYEMVATEAFREDLLYRINTVEIRVPPLRERTEDIPLMAEHFLRMSTRKYRKPIKRISNHALERLQQYAWPGNVRELKHAVERAVILSDGTILETENFLLSKRNGIARESREALTNLNLVELERIAIRKALSKHGGNITHSAEELGLTRKSLYRRIEKYGL